MHLQKIPRSTALSSLYWWSNGWEVSLRAVSRCSGKRKWAGRHEGTIGSEDTSGVWPLARSSEDKITLTESARAVAEDTRVLCCPMVVWKVVRHVGSTWVVIMEVQVVLEARGERTVHLIYSLIIIIWHENHDKWLIINCIK